MASVVFDPHTPGNQFERYCYACLSRLSVLEALILIDQGVACFAIFGKEFPADLPQWG